MSYRACSAHPHIIYDSQEVTEQMTKMYQIIEALCRAHHTNVTAMCRELGIGRSTLTELKQGRTQTLSAATTSKIAGYFNVSVAYLLGETNIPQSSSATDAEIKSALFGNAEDVTDDMFEEVKAYAKFVKERKKNGNKNSI